MSFYIIIYLVTILLSFFIGYKVFSKYHNLSGLFFLIFSISIGLWFFIYFLTFFTTSDIDLLLLYSRTAFGISIIGLYSFILFIYFFNKKNEKLINKKSIIIILFYILILLLYIKTKLIIGHMFYDELRGDYYEYEGLLFNFHLVLSILFFPFLILISFFKLKRLNYINRERLKYILFGIIIFIGLGLIFQLILPIFDIRLFEKSTILFVLPFLLFTGYSIIRYHFTDFIFRISKLLTFIISLLITIFVFVGLKVSSLSIGNNFTNYWGISNYFSYIDLVFGIILFSILNNVISRYVPGNIEYDNFNLELNKLKERIPFITNVYDLNIFLTKEAKSKFNVGYINIKLFEGLKNNNSEIYNYFNNNINVDIFINDIVFIEENKNKFNKDLIINELNKNIAIIFPMINNLGKIIGIFELGKKPLKEQYYTEEINIIRDFVGFITGHIKYISIYSKINDLNINLDKRVDEKTIEFNNLISKQREFISMSSHEIKTPVMAASLQVENFLEELELGNYNKLYLLEETKILKDQIFKISDLVKVIFSVQKHDIKNVGLYIEKVKLTDIIIGEYDILYRIYPNINFDINLSDNIGFIDIDKIQFTQVISNLLNNAIKFVNKNNPIIKINADLKLDYLELIIEDNGLGFNSLDEKNIFDKYLTGVGKSVGIGMGLYLCKKIVELHGGSIEAKNSKKLGGAKFKILIPKVTK